MNRFRRFIQMVVLMVASLPLLGTGCELPEGFWATKWAAVVNEGINQVINATFSAIFSGDTTGA